MTDAAADTVTIVLDGWAHGGDAVGRLPDGRACFVPRALPGETVVVRVRRRHKRHAEADLVEVLDPSPHRVEPPCPYYDDCGGCQLQHAAPDHQLALKHRVLVEQLQRIGKVPDPPVRGVAGPEGAWPTGYRAWARMGVTPDGHLGFRRARSDEVVPIDRCMLLTEDAQRLREALGDRWAGADEVTLTAGDDGATALVAIGDAGLPVVPDGPFGVALATGRGRAPQVLRGPGRVRFEVGATSLQASAGAFFQAGPAAAAALVGAVVDAVDPTPGLRVLDCYAGVGLFSAPLAAAGAVVTAIESDAAAVADARANLDGTGVAVVHDTVEAVLDGWTDPVDVVVLDPPRAGARADVCASLTAIAPQRIVYVACDPAALARDVATLRSAGWDLVSVDGLDLFGHTAHVEAVAVLQREAG